MALSSFSAIRKSLRMLFSVGFRATFCAAVLVQIVVCLDLDLDLSAKGHKPDEEECPAGHEDKWTVSTSTTTTTTPQSQCSLIPPDVPQCSCECENGDCDYVPKDLLPCGSVVFYFDQKYLRFSSDDQFYQTRCNDQTECVESLLCYATCCIYGKGADFMKRLMRSAQFEILDECHSNADPTVQEEFKNMTNCSNAIWPNVYYCTVHFKREVLSAVKKHEVDLARFCCAYNDFSDCVYKASQVKDCDASQQLFYKYLIPRYLGDADRLICSDQSYSPDSTPCRHLQPLHHKEREPPLILEVFILFARGLSVSSKR